MRKKGKWERAPDCTGAPIHAVEPQRGDTAGSFPPQSGTPAAGASKTSGNVRYAKKVKGEA
jgi:hypothetical protein